MINDEILGTLRLPSKLFDEIEQKVVQLYIDCNIHKLPIDPYKIIKAKGYVLIPFYKLTGEELARIKSDKKDAVSFWNPAKKQFVICYDEKVNTQRIRFTLMHEVGHIVMEHKQESALANKIANVFASYALAPYPLIYKMKCEDGYDVANAFDMSFQAASIAFERYLDRVMCGKVYDDYELKLLSLFN